MSKKISIIGGSGFLGLNLSREFYRRGFDIMIYDLKKPKLNFNFIYKKGDVLDLKNLVKFTTDSDYLINLSGIAEINYSRTNYMKTINHNVLGTLNTLEACKINRIKNYAFSSTIYVYSEHGSFYKSSKQSAECIIQEFCNTFEINFKILRYGSLYGSGAQNWNGIKKYVIEILKNRKVVYHGTGNEIRQLIHIDDACKLSADIITNKKIKNKSFTITGNKSISSSRILGEIFRLIGYKKKISFKKIKKNLHYSRTPYTYKPIKSSIIKPKKDKKLKQGIIEILDELNS